MKISRTEKTNFTATSVLNVGKDAPKDLVKLGRRLCGELEVTGGANVTHNINIGFNGISIKGVVKNNEIASLFETPMKALTHGFKQKLAFYGKTITKADI